MHTKGYPHDIKSTISYLARDQLWSREKPYIADFAVPEGAALSNQIIKKEHVTIYDLRGQNGFCLISVASRLTATEALHDPRACEARYFDEVNAALRGQFPEYRRFECIDLTVRKREPTFPWEGEEKRFDLLNIWRPLQGPNDDWPLAICDGLTVSSQDVRDSDVIHYNQIGENSLLHSNEQHRWYYLSGQATDECLVFRNVSSDPQNKRAFHAAFYNPRSNGEARVSAEVRVLAFF
ncbi:hypothetical protein F5Y10DRAFT_280843 [Nemania abortiva]|nr:hypothetical protein F5Y10DRAFT_280843 [Nemania abortiva]